MGYTSMGPVCINGGQGGSFNVPWEERQPHLGLDPSVSLAISQHCCLLSASVQYEGNDFDGLADRYDNRLVSQHQLIVLAYLTYHASHRGFRSVVAGYRGGEEKCGS